MQAEVKEAEILAERVVRESLLAKAALVFTTTASSALLLTLPLLLMLDNERINVKSIGSRRTSS
jgi:hypothetical protein